MNRRTAGVLGSVTTIAAVATLALAPGATASGGESLRAVGLTDDNRLVRFMTNAPGGAQVLGEVEGLVGDTDLVGIDFRVQNDRLYGVGNMGGIYTIGTKRQQATKVSQLTVPLEGETYGVDFNPAADRLRIISDTGQNLRHDVNTPVGPTTLDGTLSYPPTPPPATGVNGVAYTNNDLDMNTSTTLYDFDTMMDQIAIQSPANSGQLAATGKTGVDAVADAGFDTYSELEDGTTQALRPFAALEVGGKYRLYTVRLFTGDVHLVGAFPNGIQVSDLAVRLDQ